MGWLDNVFSTIGSAVKGVIGGPAASVNSVINNAGGDVAKAALNVVNAGNVVKAGVSIAGGVASAGALGGLATTTLGKLTDKRLGGITGIPIVNDALKSGISNINLTSLIGGIDGGSSPVNPTPNPFLGGGQIEIPEIKIPLPEYGYKTPPSPETPPAVKTGIPVWGYVVGGVVVAALLGVGAAKKLVRSVGLKI